MLFLEVLTNRDHKWRNAQLTKLAEDLQNKIRNLQNPDSNQCDKRKKLVCQLNKGCGFGCQVRTNKTC